MRSLPPLSVRNKVPAPDVVDPLGPGGDDARGTTPPPGLSPPSLHPQPTLPPDALHEFSAHVPTVPAQGAGEFAIALPGIFARQGPHLFVQPLEPGSRAVLLQR
jgi:hypothetical protein